MTLLVFESWQAKSFPLRVAAWLEGMPPRAYQAYLLRRQAAGCAAPRVIVTVRSRRRVRIHESGLSSDAQAKLAQLRRLPPVTLRLGESEQRHVYHRMVRTFSQLGLPCSAIPHWRFYDVRLADQIMANKEGLVDAMRATGITKKQAEDALNAALIYIKTKVYEEEQPLRLAGFGTFAVKHRKARNGRNPATGAALTIPASAALAFAPASALKRQEV